MKSPLLKRRSIQAFSLVEAMIAMAVGVMALSGAFLLDSHQLRLVKSTRESGAASLALEERVEQLRIATWRQITSADYLKGTYFATVPKSIAPLAGFCEQVTVTAWPATSDSAHLTVEKRQGSLAEVLSQDAGVVDQRLAKVDVRISWQSAGGRTRVRELATIISNGGISRMNLPSMGNAAGVPANSTPAPATTPVPSSGDTSSNPSATPVPQASTPVAATPHGNNGRGNVSGKPGKA